MGNKQSIQKINFEDMQSLIKSKSNIIINTLKPNNQSCLISNTLSPETEIIILNNLLIKKSFNKKIIVYGMNSCDITLIIKYNQLIKIVLTNILFYIGV